MGVRREVAAATTTRRALCGPMTSRQDNLGRRPADPSRSAPVGPGTEHQAKPDRRLRMTGKQRREQLLDIGRSLFAEQGFDATSVEEIAQRAGVSKPVVYEHFGGKEGLYAVVVDREMSALLATITGALTSTGHPRELLERAAFAMLDYVEQSSDGFRILVRDSPVASSTGSFASLLSDAASHVEHIMVNQFRLRGFDAKHAPMYAQMLVGMVALTGQWWLDERKPKKADVAAHLVNLAWNGLSGLEAKPGLLAERLEK
jgi:AcrR family transcriptional regulator